MSDSSNLSSLIGDYIEDYLELKMQEKQFNAIYGRSYRVYKLQQNKLNRPLAKVIGLARN